MVTPVARRFTPIGAAIVISMLACSKESGRTNTDADTSCAALAANRMLDEQCAIAIAKQEILKRQHRMPYAGFTASFESQEGLWLVTAYVDPPIPGGHVNVLIRPDGTVHAYDLGE